ncbi:SDR family oxidoreductase [Roseibium sp. FZY0029]|uniref:NAD-dependent epimerase/dehydratase family protein n=1 Tax=Roseibium sp. FZY0029 TaxID=3116647 RepID=UPI002EBB5628|nr:SDR family oxidoreductase [Roseibium sp. FZY0029]
MHVLLTGASGVVGRFVLKRLLDDGCRVTILGRRPVEGFETGFCAYDLADLDPQLPPADALVHCALVHAPGKFRGGEGDDPEQFTRLNVDGTRRLFEAACKAGCRAIVFLSSRAVYGDHRRGETFSEADVPTPDTLYGDVKLAGEQALEGLCGPGLNGIVLRATGVYGVSPGLADHKWSGLFKEFAAGVPIEPRKATEVHGEDLAAAVALVLKKTGVLGAPFQVYNVSDLLLDRQELLALYATEAGLSFDGPAASAATPGEMMTDRLRALGWVPGGRDRLKTFVHSLARRGGAGT